MLRHLFTLGVAYAASCPGYIATQCICEGDQGAGYEGTMDHSDKGIKCMDWKDAPKKRYRDKGLPANYCRNVNGYDGGVWCYTEGGSWGYCDVPTCGCKDLNPSECGCSDFKLADYRGTINVTKSGKPCQAWDSQTPNIHPFVPGTSEYDHYGMESNYCRNPGMMAETPWCYIAEDSGQPWDKTWDVCDIPVCGESEYTNELEVRKYHTGYYGDGKKFRGIGARVKPVKPLKDGDRVRVRVDGHWRNTDSNDVGEWGYFHWGWRPVGVKAKVEAAIFNKKNEQISPIVKTYVDGTGLNKFYKLKTKKIAVRTDDTYSGISASGNTVLPLLPGEHVVLKLDGKKRNIEIDRAGNWKFKDDTVRKMGEKVTARVSIYDKNGRETTAGWNLSYTGK